MTFFLNNPSAIRSGTVTPPAVSPVQEKEPEIPAKALTKNASTKRKRSANEKKKPVDPTKPKRPMSAYNYFFKYEHARILERNARNGIKESFEQVAKLIGTRWKSLGEKELTGYENMAKDDTDRYKAAMNKFYDDQNERRRAKYFKTPTGEDIVQEDSDSVPLSEKTCQDETLSKHNPPNVATGANATRNVAIGVVPTIVTASTAEPSHTHQPYIAAGLNMNGLANLNALIQGQSALSDHRDRNSNEMIFMLNNNAHQAFLQQLHFHSTGLLNQIPTSQTMRYTENNQNSMWNPQAVNAAHISNFTSSSDQEKTNLSLLLLQQLIQSLPSSAMGIKKYTW